MIENSKWSAKEQFLALNSFLVSGNVPISLPVLTFKCLIHSP